MFIVSEALDRIDLFLTIIATMAFVGTFIALIKRRPYLPWPLGALALGVTILLPGCATSSEQIARLPMEKVYVSDQPAATVAACVAGRLNGKNPLTPQGVGHLSVERFNLYGTPIARWDFYQTAMGTRIEFRQINIAIASGQAKAATCY